MIKRYGLMYVTIWLCQLQRGNGLRWNCNKSAVKNCLKRVGINGTTYGKVKQMQFRILSRLSQSLGSKYLYRLTMGKSLNLKEPRDFNEKLQWLKLYWQNPLIVKCTNKYEVRDYVESCGCKEILNELYGVYDNSSQIDWDSLPEKFVLKATHGCGFNIICDDKSKLDKVEICNTLNKWMQIDFSRPAAEFHYAKIRPRIICERYLGSESAQLPSDYKVYCFNGKPKLILVCSERGNGRVKLAFLDLQWNKLDIASDIFHNDDDPPKQPKCFDDMLKYSEQLSKPFPFVRMDFYVYNDAPVFGEMTFTPAGCMATYYNEHGLTLLGDMLELPAKRRWN